MNKKYELTKEFKIVEGRKLFRIKAVKSFLGISKGSLGGFVESENNLSHSGDAWVYEDASVYGSALVCDNALVCGNARIYDDARIYGNAQVYGNAWISGGACVSGNAQVYGNTHVYGNASISDITLVCDNARIYGNARVYCNTHVYGNASFCGDALLRGDADYTTIKGFWPNFGTTTFFRCADDTIKVVSGGRFLGTLDEFRKHVKNTRTEKVAEEFLMIANLMELHFKNSN